MEDSRPTRGSEGNDGGALRQRGHGVSGVLARMGRWRWDAMTVACTREAGRTCVAGSWAEASMRRWRLRTRVFVEKKH
ncbi:hypothetical protein GOBAR_DD11228 [Gossypium barbadense]|nr:hypothetical protein GOBAR_DD11228 [Gossypium barbadense]